MYETVFIGSVLIVFFAYLGYPLSLFFTGFIKSRTVKKYNIYPSITLLITAYNEEKRIKNKLDNTIAIDYPKDKIQILVASDGSTDGTHDIVKEYEDKGVELFIVKNRGGKENAQKEALSKATGEIIVFSDVATRIDSHGIKKIVSNFADPTIGCVSSEDRLINNDGEHCGEGVYVRYEMWLRRLESRVNSLVGLSGSFFAARKEVCQNFSGTMQSDFGTLLNSMRIGLRGVSDPESIGYYLDISDNNKEFERKVRTVLRGLTVFFNNLEFLNISKYGFFSYQFFCHKLLRWLVPFFLITAFCSNLLLALYSMFYSFIFLLHILFYVTAFLNKLRHKKLTSSLLKVPFYFTVVNYAILIAWFKFLSGERIVKWNPSERRS